MFADPSIETEPSASHVNERVIAFDNFFAITASPINLPTNSSASMTMLPVCGDGVVPVKFARSSPVKKKKKKILLIDYY